MQGMTTILKVPDGAPGHLSHFCKLFLGPVQEATGGATLLGGQPGHSECSCVGEPLSPIMVEVRAVLRCLQVALLRIPRSQPSGGPCRITRRSSPPSSW